MSEVVNPIYCNWDTSSFFLIFSDNVFGNLIYYSHLLPTISLLVFSTVLLWQNPFNQTTRTLAFVSISFALWSFCDLVLWATANPDVTMFFWSIIIHFEIFVYFGALYFITYYLSNSRPSLFIESLLFLLYIPLFLFTHTKLNLIAFDYTNCSREALEGNLVYYVYAVEIFIAVFILIYGIVQAIFNKRTERTRLEVILATTGTSLFLLSFSLGNILGSLEIDWILGQYGLFAAPLFIVLLAYLALKYQRFSVKLFATQILVIFLAIIVGSILFLRTIESVRIVTTITVICVGILGLLLVRSVKREIQQRELLEKLTMQLEAANNRLQELDKLKSEFVSIASHQLRSPLTSMRGYASMLMDGSYGSIPEKAKEAVSRIADSSLFMAKMVENYLNVSRIESGNMKYELSDFNLRLEVEKLIDDKRQEAMKKGLLLTFKSQLGSQAIVHADIGKTLEIVHNLLNNALKYTPKGSIDVLVRDDQKKRKIYVDIKDSGIGISKEDAEKLFGKFQRATNANSVNTTGTGLGLYVARTMALAMKGEITAYSVGPGTGSTFTFELPLMM